MREPRAAHLLTGVVYALSACHSSPQPVSDSSLRSTYQSHQVELNSIVALVLADPECAVIRADRVVGCESATSAECLRLLPIVGAYAVYRDATDVRVAYGSSGMGQKRLAFRGQRPA